MDEKDKTKIAFFFGAGVEGKGNFGMEMGFDYLRKSLFASIFPDNNKESGFTCYLGKYWKGMSFFEGTYAYSSHTVDGIEVLLKNLIMHRCEKDDDLKKTYQSQIELLLSLDRLKKIYGNNFARDGQDRMEEQDDLKEEFAKIVTGQREKYSEIQFDIFKALFSHNQNGRIIVDMNIGVSGSLESYFHTIIDPAKYGKVKFSKIINYYWACYFTILRSVLRYLYTHGVEKAKFYLCPPSYLTLDYEKVLNHLVDVTKLIYDTDLNYSMEGTYYQYIIDRLQEYASDLLCVGVITTNYYRFCSKINERTVYLNGQLKYFECPEYLEVVDLAKDDIDRSTLCFPFLFGQSMLKPIVNHQQIREFAEFKSILDEADILIVFGFNINEDDNHINAFLHDFTQKKKIIIVTDQSESEFEAKKKLRCDMTNIRFCKVSYEPGSNERIVDQIFETIKALADEK